MNRARLSLSVIVFIVAAAIAVVVSTSGSGTSKALSAPGATAAISVRQTSVGRVADRCQWAHAVSVRGRQARRQHPVLRGPSGVAAGHVTRSSGRHRRGGPREHRRRERDGPPGHRSPTAAILCITSSAIASRGRSPVRD